MRATTLQFRGHAISSVEARYSMSEYERLSKDVEDALCYKMNEYRPELLSLQPFSHSWNRCQRWDFNGHGNIDIRLGKTRHGQEGSCYDELRCGIRFLLPQRALTRDSRCLIVL
jgi:hypothetical protein